MAPSGTKPIRHRTLLFLSLVVSVVLPTVIFLFLVRRPPTEQTGPEPRKVFAPLPLKGAISVSAVRWSPSGKYLLIVADTGDPFDYLPNDNILLVLDAGACAVFRKLEGIETAFWGRDNVLWVWRNRAWAIYEPPFVICKTVQAPAEMTSDNPFDGNHLDGHVVDVCAVAGRVATAVNNEGEHHWTITVYENGSTLLTVEITPDIRSDSPGMRGPALSFSPDGGLLAVVISGWIAYESPAAEEFWIVDVDAKSVRHLCNGKTKWWQVFDVETQRLHPSWSSDGKNVVYGDGESGIEEMYVATGRTRTLLGKGTDVYDACLSPTGRWISFERWPGDHADPTRYHHCFGVLSRNGRRIIHLPHEYTNWPYMYSAWHPHRDLLAIIVKHPEGDAWDLLHWTPDREATSR